jgi:excisionase family DNA binding protein
MPSHTPDGRLWYDIDESAEAVNVCRRTIWNWLKAGKLEARRTPGGAVRIDAEQLLVAYRCSRFHTGRRVTLQ